MHQFVRGFRTTVAAAALGSAVMLSGCAGTSIGVGYRVSNARIKQITGSGGTIAMVDEPSRHGCFFPVRTRTSSVEITHWRRTPSRVSRSRAIHA